MSLPTTCKFTALWTLHLRKTWRFRKAAFQECGLFLSEQICNGNNKNHNVFSLKLHAFIKDNCSHIFNTNETKLMAFGLESSPRVQTGKLQIIQARVNQSGKSLQSWPAGSDPQDFRPDPWRLDPLRHLKFATSIVALVIVPKEFLTTWQGCDGYQTKLERIFFNTFWEHSATMMQPCLSPTETDLLWEWILSTLISTSTNSASPQELGSSYCWFWDHYFIWGKFLFYTPSRWTCQNLCGWRHLRSLQFTQILMAVPDTHLPMCLFTSSSF